MSARGPLKIILDQVGAHKDKRLVLEYEWAVAVVAAVGIVEVVVVVVVVVVLWRLRQGLIGRRK